MQSSWLNLHSLFASASTIATCVDKSSVVTQLIAFWAHILTLCSGWWAFVSWQQQLCGCMSSSFHVWTRGRGCPPKNVWEMVQVPNMSIVFSVEVAPHSWICCVVVEVWLRLRYEPSWHPRPAQCLPWRSWMSLTFYKWKDHRSLDPLLNIHVNLPGQLLFEARGATGITCAGCPLNAACLDLTTYADDSLDHKFPLKIGKIWLKEAHE